MGGHVIGLIHTVTMLDVIDILVVAFFLNKLYQMLKNTRAASLVKGLLMLLAIMLISKWLNLYVINWILEKFMTVVMIALPVVFQPELRRALEQIGRGKLFRRSTVLNEMQVENMLEAVATTADDLSRNKIGALMVFERETGLDDYIETGIPIDGLISTALFENIFIPNTPPDRSGQLPFAFDGSPEPEPGTGDPAPGGHRPFRTDRCPDPGGQ